MMYTKHQRANPYDISLQEFALLYESLFGKKGKPLYNLTNKDELDFLIVMKEIQGLKEVHESTKIKEHEAINVLLPHTKNFAAWSYNNYD